MRILGLLSFSKFYEGEVAAIVISTLSANVLLCSQFVQKLSCVADSHRELKATLSF